MIKNHCVSICHRFAGYFFSETLSVVTAATVSSRLPLSTVFNKFPVRDISERSKAAAVTSSLLLLSHARGEVWWSRTNIYIYTRFWKTKGNEFLRWQSRRKLNPMNRVRSIYSIYDIRIYGCILYSWRHKTFLVWLRVPIYCTFL